MNIPYFRVSAFTEDPFRGNPAGVCLLENWLPDEILQKIARENNLAETAYLVPKDNGFGLRWFTPAIEVDLCGHATLASAFVLFTERGVAGESVSFETRSGPLRANRKGDLVELDFPAWRPEKAPPPPVLQRLFPGAQACYKTRDYLLVFKDEAEVAELKPDFQALLEVDALGVVVTAPGWEVDFVSRFFAPAAGIPEDPATGSTHCALIPYWAGRLSRNVLRARQLSPRQGELWCELKGDRVSIAGNAAIYYRGELVLAG